MRSGAFLQTLLACHQSSDAHCSSERESPRCSREEGKSWREAGRLALLEGLSGEIHGQHEPLELVNGQVELCPCVAPRLIL